MLGLPPGRELGVFSPKLPVSTCPCADFGSFCSPGLSTEGIYRVSGNKSEMESLQRQFDQGNTHTRTLNQGSGCGGAASVQ